MKSTLFCLLSVIIDYVFIFVSILMRSNQYPINIIDCERYSWKARSQKWCKCV